MSTRTDGFDDRAWAVSKGTGGRESWRPLAVWAVVVTFVIVLVILSVP